MGVKKDVKRPMNGSSHHLIRMDAVRDRLNDPDTVIADCRFVLGQPLSGQQAYREAHLPGAVYFDLERDLSGPKREHGGRHPLPGLEELARKLGEAGIDEHVTVIAYDDQDGAMASRLWWLLRYMGHDRVMVMEGGFSRWRAAGNPVTAEQTALRKARSFTARIRPELVVGVEEVRGMLDRAGRDVVLIDSREEKRYLGEEEAIDPAAGHIPGAVNRFWKDNLEPDGSWKHGDALLGRFGDLLAKGRELIVYCGSGVTACPNVLALAEAGRPDAKLYLGSWSDWVSYSENPVATGKEQE